ncbi:MAG: adenylate/guanylate cyclase domain-containing protein [Desulfarculus sp.]|nr:adenylate/guanylate cyclase domain-containing protein [Desulfarculus sp.]
MAAHQNLQTVLFVDICGSTAIYENLGDGKAHGLIAKTLALMQANVEAKSGRVVKTLGDEIMACFWHPVYALDAAKAINSQLAEEEPEPGLPVVAVHSGLEHGQVLEQGGDLYGDAVNIAARLASMAKPWQILTTQKTIEALGSDSDETTRHIVRTAMRGKTEEVDVYEVLWEDGGLTRFAAKPQPLDMAERLRLTLGSRQLEVNPGHPVATLGRGPQNDLVVADKGVSRWHARVELRRGKFFLVDKSTNGTFIVTDGKEPVYLNYDESLLPPRGAIILGSDDQGDHKVKVSFELC